MFVEQRFDLGSIAYVTAHEDVSRIIPDRGEIAEIAGVRQLVEVDDRLGVLRTPFEYEVTADKARAARDQDHALFLYFPSQPADFTRQQASELLRMPRLAPTDPEIP